MGVTKKGEKESTQKKELTETQRWGLGMILFLFSCFLLVAVVSYYFCWASDQNFVVWGDLWRAGNERAANLTGNVGALLANYLVGQWFGVFGVIVPAVLIVLALRVINYRPTILRKSVRTALIIMILGSLSLGYIFGYSWGVFGSGLGGAHGVLVSQWLEGMIGSVGTGLALLLGWILIGLYINSRRTIAVVNRVGKGVFDGGKIVGETVIDHASDIMNLKRDRHLEESEQGPDTEPVLEPEEQKEKRLSTPSPLSEKSESEIEIVDSRKREQQSEPYGDITTLPPQSEESTMRTLNDAYRESGYVGVGRYVETGEKNEADDGIVVLGAADQGLSGGGTGAMGSPRGRVGSNNSPFEIISEHPTTHTQSSDGGDSPFEIISEHPTTQAESRGSNSPFEIIARPEGSGVEGESAQRGVVDGSEPDFEIVVAERRDEELEGEGRALYDPTLELSRYKRPMVELLTDHSIDVQVTKDEVLENKNQIVQTLKNFGIEVGEVKATIGPTVTLYEIVPAAGVRISKIKNLEDDIALNLKALGIRIIAPMPGQGTIGIEVPNRDKEIVSMYSMVKTKSFRESDYELPVVLGKTISNETFMIDLAKMPHLLVAGATGQGKSVGLNAIITSLLYSKHPSELKFVLVDPKRVELSLYSRLEKHFLAKMESEDEAILTDTKKVVYTLEALCVEMSERYDLLRAAQVKKISEYNEKFKNRRLNPEKGHRFLPYIVVIIDEFADMIMTSGREIETPVTRLAQLARAVGIHLVIATQRPDVKVITGLIKANFPARIAFRVTSMVDSRTILDQPGANQLIGRGDMLISINGEVTRVQCAFVDTPEIEKITEFISNQKGYHSAYELPDYRPESEMKNSAQESGLGELDAIFRDVARFVVDQQQGSTSSIQRRFSIGYNRAGRIMDQLEALGIVSAMDGSKGREVLLMDPLSLEDKLDGLGG